MEQFTINRNMLKFSWIFLLVWVISMGMIIVFLAMGHPLWFFMISGLFLFFFWIIIASTYPKTVLVGDDSIAFQLPGSDKIQTFKHEQLELSRNKKDYEFIVSGTKKRKKFWISRKDIPVELEAYLKNQFFQ